MSLHIKGDAHGALQDAGLYRDGAGVAVTCTHCRDLLFWRRRVKLNSSRAELLGLGWASEESETLTCSNCGFMMEFMPKGLTLTKDKG
ncbi:hypothetical protein [Leekyejoonella antrihumi]|uniref:DNA-binding protein n=1 Tax=Leekyejoonella antrihumi TaxID=1660198 RepID=A0A563E403_9MICO|nr:hypothetical protein [Leekyejoonella antrihumi]TWP36973.1 hypothetical protein FGL98_07905 [Leekyejoonella antrihumi]